MEVSKADLCDRYTILLLKDSRLPDNPNVRRELAAYEAALLSRKLDNFIERLYIVNAQIWHLEADIRAGKEGELGLEEVGRRALKIRDLNRERIAIKNEIAEKFGEFIEVKGQHASEKDCQPVNSM